MNYLNLEFIWVFIFMIPFIHSQKHDIHHVHDVHDHHHSDDHIHHTHRVARLHSIPPVGTSEYVRHFARQTSDQLKSEHDIHHVPRTISYVAEPACCDTVVETVKHVHLPDNHHHHHDPHASHRNFLTAGINRYYTVRSPASHEPHAPIVGFYHSSYQDRNRGGKLYLGNRPFYF